MKQDVAVALDEATHTYTLNGVVTPGVSDVLVAGGVIDKSFYTENKRSFGSKVHKASQFLDEGDIALAELHPKIALYLNDWEIVKDEHKIEMLAIEKPIGSAIWRVCGKPDRLALVDGEKAILDIKTGESEAWHPLQMAGYEAILGPGWRRIAVHLKGDSRPRLREYKDKADVNIFLSALAVLQWRMAHQNYKIVKEVAA